MNLAEYRDLIKRSKKRRATTGERGMGNGERRVKGKGPNATEAAFNRDILGGGGIFEGMSFKIAGGHRYTPDFIVSTPSGIEAYEVKGSYRFPSEGRARLAFDDARERYPSIKFYWFRKDKTNWRDET
jgi:hypothetical protein